jgi:hypothetical protein
VRLQAYQDELHLDLRVSPSLLQRSAVVSCQRSCSGAEQVVCMIAVNKRLHVSMRVITTHHEVAHTQCIMRVRLTCERYLLTPKTVNLVSFSTSS